MIRLAIAEDHIALIDAIKLLLAYEDDIEIVGTATNGKDLLKLVELKRPNVVIVDIKMPKMDGISATKEIKTILPQTKIIAFTMFDQHDAISQMIDAGVSGYLLKISPLEEILKAIRTVHVGSYYFDANLNLKENPKEKKQGKSLLTDRQIEILNLIGQGKSSQDIADELYIGIATVASHRKNMIRILGLKGKGELLRYAVEKKYLFNLD